MSTEAVAFKTGFELGHRHTLWMVAISANLSVYFLERAFMANLVGTDTTTRQKRVRALERRNAMVDLRMEALTALVHHGYETRWVIVSGL